MEQQRALNALEGYLALSKTANSPRAAADLVTQATSAANTFVFAELLQTPKIQALNQSPEHAPYLRLLEIFAWGTWADYIGVPSLSAEPAIRLTLAANPSLPPLSPQQEEKLKLLSLLPLASGQSSLTYDYLLTSLQLPSKRALEHLITTAIYADLLRGSLDPFHNTITISSVAPLRDIAPGSIPSQIALLAAWSARCDNTLAELEAQIAHVKATAKQRELRKRRVAGAVEDAVEKSMGKGNGAQNGGGMLGGKQRSRWEGHAPGTYNDGDEMDLDETLGGTGTGGRIQTRNSAKRGFGGGRR